MKSRRIFILMTILLSVQFMIGCTLFESENEDLPKGRRVRTVPFPVRHLEFTSTSCTQELEIVDLSGVLTNVSPYPLYNIGVKIKIFFADDMPKRVVVLPATPTTIMPGKLGTFAMKAEVEDPVSHIEIHPLYDRQ